jgi:aminoglycoside 6'-N-acetyltransferase
VSPTDQQIDPLPRSAGPALLRRLRESDLTRFHSYRSDPAVGRFQGWSPMTPPEALAFIDEMANAELFVSGQWAQVAIAQAPTDELVGDIGLCVAEDGQSAEVGFTLHPAARGLGLATAAVQEAIRLLWERTGVDRIIGVTDTRNAASMRVLERVGMRRIESRETVFKGEPCTEWVYAIERRATAPAPMTAPVAPPPPPTPASSTR